MKTQASYEIEPYEVSGYELRVHWDIEKKTKEDMNGATITFWEANEALCNRKDSRAQIIEKIMQTVYPTFGAEIAAIRNGGQNAEDHQTLRDQAKALADGWLQRSK
jgi:hypothetical protein